jgi:hypothetical protein
MKGWVSSFWEDEAVNRMFPAKLSQWAKGVTGAQILGNILILCYD